MRKIIIALTFMLHNTAFADSLDGYLSKMTKTIDQDGRAVFCVAQIPTGERRDQSIFWPKSATCIGEVSIGAGMAQRSGCAAFHLNVYNLSTSGVGSGGRQKIIEGKDCEQSFEQLMVLNVYGYVDEPAGKDKDGNANLSVGWLFYDGARVDWMKPVVVYVKKSTLSGLFNKKTSYEEWFAQKRTALVTEQANDRKRKPASGGNNEQ